MPLFTKKKQVVQMFDLETKKNLDFEEDKPYLVLLQDIDADRDQDTQTGRFIATRGRSSVFWYLESEIYNIDPIHSYVMSGKIPLGSEVSVYSFIRLCVEKNKVDDFSINLEELEEFIHSSIDRDVDLNLLYNSEINRPIKRRD